MMICRCEATVHILAAGGDPHKNKTKKQNKCSAKSKADYNGYLLRT